MRKWDSERGRKLWLRSLARTLFESAPSLLGISGINWIRPRSLSLPFECFFLLQSLELNNSISHLEPVGELDAVVVGRGEAGGQREHGDEREEGLFHHHGDFCFFVFAEEVAKRTVFGDWIGLILI